MNESFQDQKNNKETEKNISRRNFLKRLVSAGVGAVMLNSCKENIPRKPSEVEMPKILPTLDSIEVNSEEMELSDIMSEFYPSPESRHKGYYEISFVLIFKPENQEGVKFSFGGIVKYKKTYKTNGEILKAKNLTEILNLKENMETKSKILKGKDFYKKLDTYIKKTPKNIKITFDNEKVIKVETLEEILWDNK